MDQTDNGGAGGVKGQASRLVTKTRKLGLSRRHWLKARQYGETFRRRLATATGAVALGLAALLFAKQGDQALALFDETLRRVPFAGWILTPLGFAAIVWATRRLAPEARGSGIPQVIEGSHNPGAKAFERLTSLKTAAVKYLLTLAMLAVGGAVGREGPTVQISAAIMQATHRLFRIELTSAVILAGGAAGVSAAFNTPLAGVAFAIEELAAAYEQRLALLAMAAVMVSGLVSLGIAGDYIYFGAMHDVVSIRGAFLVCPVAGVLGGVLGGLFSRCLVGFGATQWPPIALMRGKHALWAAICGLAVAALAYLTGGLTWGTGYGAAKAMIEGQGGPLWYGPAKIAATLMSAVSGAPGGIFAPSLSAGAGLGVLIAHAFPSQPMGAVAVLGMIGYFVGVVRSPLTATLIVSEMTDSRAMLIPLVATALIADGVSALVFRERLYHALAKSFRPASPHPATPRSLPTGLP